MDILDMIRDDHDAALAAIAKLDKLAEGGAAQTLRAELRQLVVDVRLHAKSEEAALYEALEVSRKDLRDFSLEGTNEHECLDLMLEKLLTTPPGKDGELKAVLKVCKDLIEHHGKQEEEQELFPKLRKVFSKDELMAMASVMQAEKERLRPRIEREASASRSRASNGAASTTPQTKGSRDAHQHH